MWYGFISDISGNSRWYQCNIEDAGEARRKLEVEAQKVYQDDHVDTQVWHFDDANELWGGELEEYLKSDPAPGNTVMFYEVGHGHA